MTEVKDANLATPGLRWQRATIVRIEDRVPGVRSFFLKLDSPFKFLAGQHVNLRLTTAEGYQVERSYSIASAPGQKETLELVIERLKNGEVSPYFHDIAAVGDDIELRGPIGGYFVWSSKDDGPVLLVGGGSGVVPLMSMIRDREMIESKVPMQLLLSARTWEQLIFRDELLALMDLDSVIVLTREKARRMGDYARRVDSSMMADVLKRAESRPRQVFVCGSNPFVESASQGLIEAGLPADIIRTERYGG